MPKLLKDDPGKLAEWLVASHLQRAPQKKPTPAG
jgi:hypothetical protein